MTDTTTTPAKYKGKNVSENMVPGPKSKVDNERIDELMGLMSPEEQAEVDRDTKKLENYRKLGKQYGVASETIYHLKLQNYYLRQELDNARVDACYFEQQWEKARRWSWFRVFSKV